MKISLKIYFCLLLTLPFSCAEKSYKADYKPSPKPALVEQISREVFIKLKNENSLYPIECGGRMMDQITYLHWGFDYYGEIQVEEGLL